VAATRARDLLVVPGASGTKIGTHVCADLLAETPAGLVAELEVYRDAQVPAWASLPAVASVAPADASSMEGEIGARWAAASAEAARPRLKPASVSGEARMIPADEAAIPSPAAEAGAAPGAMAGAAGAAGVAGKPRAGRFGSLFGTVVHRAVGLILRAPGRAVEDAVREAAQEAGLTEHLAEAAADVQRAVEALRAEGLVGPLGTHLRVEYPVAAAWDGGLLLGGYIDVVGVSGDRVIVIDIKTDAPPAGAVERAYPEYAAQVLAYGALVERAGAAGTQTSRCGLLFSGDGTIRWVA
jgi:ATP-dependent helicase/nuclease subunit A